MTRQRDPITTSGCAFATIALGVGSACVGDSTAPELLEVRFEDSTSLILRFSEPIASTEGVDPSAHFRLGAGFVLEGQDQTAYYDLSYHFANGVPGVGGDMPGAFPRHGDVVVARINPTNDPATLRLILAYPVVEYVCDTLVEAEALDIPSAIHLHYAESSHPRVTDLAGNPLADIGAWWVSVTGTATTHPGSFDELDPRIPIPCPEL